jgi:hypothetical protein
LRVHKIGAQPPSDVVKPTPAMTMFVASVGVTFR